MRRSVARSSRVLVVVLALTLTSGVFAAVYKLGKSKGVPTPLLAVENSQTAPTPPASAPATRPATQPSTPVIKASVPPAAQPTTKPVVIETPKKIVTPPVTTRPALADARGRFDGGDLLGAHTSLNDPLVSGTLVPADAAAARELLQKVNEQVIFGRKAFKDDPFVTTYTVQPGERLARIAFNNDVTWELLCRINSIPDPKRVRAMQTLKIIKGPFHAVITKSAFRMDVYLGSPGETGSVFVTSLPVGLGKDDSTPVGTWKIANKLKNPTYYSPRGEGVIDANSEKNPLGEYWLGLAGVDNHTQDKASYGIHGTIDPTSIGKAESMGCIRLRNEDITLVYEMLIENKSMVVVKE